MHKINRIGAAIISQLNRSATTPALAFSGGVGASNDTTAQVLDLTNGEITGTSVEGVATGSFTFTTTTAQAFGQQMEFDIDFGDAVAVEAWGLIQALVPSNAICLPIAGHLVALTGAVSSLVTVTDVVPLDDPDTASISSTTLIQRWLRYHGHFVAKRTSSATFKLFHGWKLLNPGADAASCNIRAFSFGYRTLADQYHTKYYDPAR